MICLCHRWEEKAGSVPQMGGESLFCVRDDSAPLLGRVETKFKYNKWELFIERTEEGAAADSCIRLN